MSSPQLSLLFHHRWSVPLIAELYTAKGSKLVTVVNRLGATRASVKQTLAALIRMGLVMRNPGYGHPLRPEYLLTVRGMRIGASCAELMASLRALGIESVGLKKWSMPVLAALSSDVTRFSALRERLGGLTDRALTLALKDLIATGLTSRLVLDTYPPTTTYQVTRKAKPVVAALEQMVLGFPRPPQELGRPRRRAV